MCKRHALVYCCAKKECWMSLGTLPNFLRQIMDFREDLKVFFHKFDLEHLKSMKKIFMILHEN